MSVIQDDVIKMKQKALKNELLRERRTPFKAPPPPKDLILPIRTLNSNPSVTTPLKQPVGMSQVLPSKFSTLQSKGRRTVSPQVEQSDKDTYTPPRRRVRDLFKIKRRSADITGISSDEIMRQRSLSQPVASDELYELIG